MRLHSIAFQIRPLAEQSDLEKRLPTNTKFNHIMQDETIGTSQAIASDEGEGDEDGGSPKRSRPNSNFLQNVVSSIKRTNQRLIAESAANAACKVGSVRS